MTNPRKGFTVFTELRGLTALIPYSDAPDTLYCQGSLIQYQRMFLNRQRRVKERHVGFIFEVENKLYFGRGLTAEHAFRTKRPVTAGAEINLIGNRHGF